jgi:putative nucleotidyltransferase with HDIG domain
MNSLKIKILGLTSIIVILLALMMAWINIGTQKKLLYKFAEQNSHLINDTIHSSIISSMASGNNTQVAKTLEKIDRGDAIKSVHIFDESGRILISSIADETGDLIAPSELLAYRSNKQAYVATDRFGEESYNTFKVLKNEKLCHSCHDPQKEILGILNLHLSLDVIQKLESSGKETTIITSFITVIILILTISGFILVYVDRPIKRVIEAMTRVEKGELNEARTHITNSAEMAQLSERFNRMVGQLKDSIDSKIDQERELAINEEKLSHHEEIQHMNITLEERLKEIEYLNISLEERIEEIEEANFKIADLASELEDQNTTLERAVERLSALYKMGLATNSIMDMNRLLDLLIRKTMETVGAHYGYILLLNKEDWSLTLAGSHGIPDLVGKEGQSIPIKPGGVSHWSIVNREALLIQDIESTKEFNKSSLLGFDRKSVLCAPLIIKDEIVGTITMSNKTDDTPFNNSDLELLTTIAAQASVAFNNSQLYEEQQRTYLSTVHALVSAIEASDTYTRGHSERVTRYSLALAKHMGLDSEALARLEQAAILHDIGKIGIDIYLLHKEERLTDEDFEKLMEHPEIGDRILEPISFLGDIRKIILQHHERYDGKGYPNKLKEDEILLEARILSVADTYDAMTSNRPYRAALSHEETIQEIKDHSGTQFDPVVARNFIEMSEDQIFKQDLVASK